MLKILIASTLTVSLIALGLLRVVHHIEKPSESLAYRLPYTVASAKRKGPLSYATCFGPMVVDMGFWGYVQHIDLHNE